MSSPETKGKSFDWSKYGKQPEVKATSQEQQKPSENFNWDKYQEETQASSPFSIAAREYAAGIPGTITDALNLAKQSGLLGLASNLIPETMGSHEISQEIQKHTGGREPRTGAERYGSSIGKFAGQGAGAGALLGGAAGPVGALAGAGAGTIGGALLGTVYQTAEELLGEEAAPWLTLLAAFSPTAFKTIASKISPKFKNILPKEPPSVELPSGGAPPEPPGVGLPPGRRPPPPPPPESPISKIAKEISSPELPRSMFETAEIAIEDIKPITEGKPLGKEIAVETAKEAPSLKGRVSPEPSLGESITKQAFESEAQAGRQISEDIKAKAKESRKPVEEAYKKARDVTEDHSGIYPELARKNDALVKELEQVQKRNAGQEAVYQQALAIRNLVGETDAYIGQQASRLIAQADSMSQLANYELPYVGYKGKIKGLVRDTNNAVIESLKAAGKDYSAVVNADKMYARWADRFLGDEISPFLEKKILNPESLYRTALRDEGSYRAIKKAVGSRNDPIFKKVDRALAESKMGKYYEKPQLVNSDEYIKDLKNFHELVGKDVSAEVDAALRKKKAAYERTEVRERPIRGTGERFEKAKKEKPITKLDEFAKRIAEHEKRTPEGILKKLNNRSGIRELRKELTPDSFEKLTKQKVRSILREGNITQELKADKIFEILNKEKNYEIFSEIFGKEGTDALLKVSEVEGRKILQGKLITDLIAKGVITPLAGRKVVTILKILKTLATA